MARKLEDVLDYFLPGGENPRADGNPQSDGHSYSEGSPQSDWNPESNPNARIRAERPAALPIIALPIGDEDVVHAAFAWNLVVEAARLGASATLLAPADPAAASLWPPSGRGPVGARLELVRAENLRELNRAALDVAVSRAAEARNGGVILARVPPAWVNGASDGRALLRWVLLFAATESKDLRETYGLAKRIVRVGQGSRIGITIHGARRIEEAERAFSRLADTAQRHLGHSIVSYGLLVDDLHIYRAIVAHRPIGLEHPQSRAARALRDVAKLLLDDAQEYRLG
ncbi:MAG: hypothetical protein JRD03_10360 [Deltaproteobacteria bacterium]|nr:hypothetical protein [Deltaproteobacteria bacterium]